MQRRVLVIDDEIEVAEVIIDMLKQAGLVGEVCHDAEQAERLIKSNSYHAILCDIHMPGKSGLRLLEDLVASKIPIPPFLFVSGNVDPAVLDKASRLGAADVIEKPFRVEDLIGALTRLGNRKNDRVLDVMEMIRAISGMALGPEKRALVETRLLRRVRQLRMVSLDEYFEYFRENRNKEVDELVSLLTTHTTHFFRESGHFDFLMDTVFPKLLSSGKKEIKIWSAACSSGEEAYSLAICYLEFLRGKGLALSAAPKLTVLGTDIDFNVVEHASRGIFTDQHVERMHKRLVDTYFDSGKGDLAGLVRVKDIVFNLCSFRQMNLIGRDYPREKFDVIFLRNVLIYFKSDSIKQIANSLVKNLSPTGYLFLGHSESLGGLGLPFIVEGNSIYRPESTRSTIATVKSLAVKESKGKTKVFIIDDSGTIRAMLRRIFSDEGFEVVGEAEHPKAVKVPLSTLDVDVVTLDIHMPVQDGVSYLREIQGKEHPPVVMISSVSYDDGVDYMNCLELGAVDYIEKPAGQNLAAEGERIRKVVAAAAAKRKRSVFGKTKNSTESGTVVPMYSGTNQNRDLILIGASTGGVEAIKVVLQSLPRATPPIVIVQHIPENFSRTMAERLNTVCPVKVSEAKDGEVLESNHAYIAPGGKQLALLPVGDKLVCRISDDPPLNRHKPSVDFLFNSAVPLTTSYRMVAAILTGMGADGAKGLLALKSAGCHTIAQDQESCVVFGMPKVAIELGAAKEIVPLQSIGYHLLKSFNSAHRRVS